MVGVAGFEPATPSSRTPRLGESYFDGRRQWATTPRARGFAGGTGTGGKHQWLTRQVSY
jgi:hypothetical protein